MSHSNVSGETIPSLAQIFFGRLANFWRRRRAQRAAPGRRLQFQAMEPRILLSADLIFNAPINLADDSFTLRLDSDSGDLELLNGETVVASRALAETSGVLINGEDGRDDSLKIDFTHGGFFSLDGGITFNGGADGFDALEIEGGAFTVVTHTVTATGPGLSGNIVYEDGLNPALTINYTGLEPVDMTGSTVADLVFNLPGTDDQAILEDDGVAGNGISQLRSQNGTPTFDLTTFSNPTGSLTVNLGGDNASFTVASLLDFTRSLTINGQAGSDNVTFTGATNLSSAGADLAITVGGSITDTAGTSLQVNDLARFNAGAGGITLGESGGDTTNFGTLTFNSTGAISIAEDSSMVLTGNNVGGSGAVDLFASGAVTFNGNIVTNGGAVTLFNGVPVVLGSPATVMIDTTNGGTVATGRSIVISGTVNDDGTPTSLLLRAGTVGTVNLQGAVGGTTPIQGLSIESANAVRLPAVQTREGGISVTTAGSSPMTRLLGNLSTTHGAAGAGDVTLVGPVELLNNIEITTDHASGADGNVSIAGAVDGDAPGRSLSLSAGGGDVTFGGAVGGGTPLQGLNIGSANDVTLQAVNTRDGGLTVTTAVAGDANSITLNGNIDTAQGISAGNVTLVGPVTLATSINAGAISATESVTVSGVRTIGAAAFNAASLVIGTGASLALNATSTLGALSLSGTLTGTGTSTLTGPGNSSWTGGAYTSTGELVVGSGHTLTIDGSAEKDFGTGTLRNQGTVLWTGGNIEVVGGATNASNAGTVVNSGLFDIQGANDFGDRSVGLGILTFNNEAGATLLKSGAGLTSIGSAGGVTPNGVNFNNAGTVEVQAGALSINNRFSITSILPVGTGTSSGTFSVAAGTALHLGGNNTLTGSSVVSGAGTVFLEHGTFSTVGTWSHTGALAIHGGTATFAPAVTPSAVTVETVPGGPTTILATFDAPVTTGPLTISEGTVIFNAATTATSLELSGTGTLRGTGIVTLAGAGDSSWTGGTYTGPGQLVVTSGHTLTIGGATEKDFGSGTLVNEGTVLWTGGNIDVVGSGAVLNRGLFDAQVSGGNFGDQSTGGGALTFNNELGATLRKSGPGLTAIGSRGGGTPNPVNLNNAGTLEVQTGTLSINHSFDGVPIAGGSLVNSGTILVLAGATLQRTGGFTSAGLVAGSGTINVGVGNTFINTGTVAPGVTSDPTDTLSITGNYAQGTNGILDIDVAGTGAGNFDALAITGGTTIAGPTNPSTLNVELLGGFTPQPGNQFRFMTFASLSGSFQTTILPPHLAVQSAVGALDLVFVNAAPVAIDDSFVTDEDTPLMISATDLAADDTDADGDLLTVTAVQGGADTHGTVSLVGGVVTYTPDVDFSGAASFSYTVEDEFGDTDTGLVSIAVNAVNDAPVRIAGAPAPVVVNEDSANTNAVSLGLGGLVYAPGPLTAVDEGVQTLTYTLVSVPSFVTVYLADGTTPAPIGTPLTDLEALRGLTYKTLADANGTANLIWTVTDSGSNTPPNSNTLTQTLSITVNAANNAFLSNVHYDAGADLLTFESQGDAANAVTVTSPTANHLRIVVGSGEAIVLSGDTSVGFLLSADGTQLDIDTSLAAISLFGIDLAGGDDTLFLTNDADNGLGSLTANGSEGSDSVTLNAISLGGSLSVTADSIVVNGSLDSGTRDMSLTASGDVFFTEDAVLNIDLGGTATDQFTTVTISGNVTLGGTLDVEEVNGFAPTSGDRFRFMTFASRAGFFDVINQPTQFYYIDDSDATDLELVFDDTSPTVTINQASGQPDPTNASPIRFTVLFSEAVLGFDASDISFAGSTLTNLTASVTGSGANYTVSVTGMNGVGRVVASVVDDAVFDIANNFSDASTSTDNMVTFDNVAPTARLNQASGQVDPTNASPILFTVLFSEVITGFTGADISFAGSTVGGTLTASVSGTGTTYTVSVTGMNGVGLVRAAVVANAATDLAGNFSAASTSTDNMVTFDNVAPTVTIDQAPGQEDPTNDSPISFTVFFSEAVLGFDAGDISFASSTLSNLTAMVTGGGANYTVTVTGMDGVGTVQASIGANAATDVAGNGNFASTSTDNMVTFDNVAPTVTIDQAPGQEDPTNDSPISFTVFFSEAVLGFDAGDISFASSTLSNLTAMVTGGGANYTVTVTGMDGVGTVQASIGANAATDVAGNGNFASTSTDNMVTFDNVAPTVTIDQAPGQEDPTNDSPISFTVFFSEAVLGFDAGDISFASSTLSNLTAMVTGGGANYTVTVTGMDGVGTVQASIGANAATDVAGNGNFASTSTDNMVTFDNVAPTVTIDQAPGQEDPTNDSPISFTVFFSEAVLGFDAGDISFASSTLSNLTAMVTGGGANYTVTVTGMDGVGTVQASIGANAATDVAGNGNFASTSTDNMVTFDNVAPTVTIDQAPGQEDPTNDSPISFTVFFSEAVLGFDAGDISFAGSTVGGTLTAMVTGSGASYTVSVAGMTSSGTVVASVEDDAATDLAGNLSDASTSTDNTVTFEAAAGGIDLVGAVTWDPDDLLIPGDHEHVTVVVFNNGDTAVHQQVKVKLYASVDQELNAGDIFLDQRLTGSDIEPGSSSTAQFNLVFPSNLLPGTYFLLAEVDPANQVPESDEENNTASGGSFDFHWMFGQVPGHGWETLTVREADGTWVNFSLLGPGTGEVTIDGEGKWDLLVTGTTGSSILSILTLGGGDRRVEIDDIHVTGALRGILAPKMDLTGTLAIDGALGAGMMIGSATDAVIAVETILGRCLSGLSVQGIAILGDLEDSEILIGADLGADGQLGGSGANADTYSDGDLGDLLITGSMISSGVRVGQDPGADGIFDTGDDVLLDGSIDSITIRGEMTDDSFFVADDLPRYALIDGRKVYIATDPRFVDSLPESGGAGDPECGIDWSANAGCGWGAGYSPFGSSGQSNFSDFLVRLFR